MPKKTKISAAVSPQKKYSSKHGLPPESMVYVGVNRSEPIEIREICYNSNSCENKVLIDVSELKNINNEGKKRWIQVLGVHDTAAIHYICKQFKIHALVEEDILNTNQRTKVEEFDDYVFLSVKHLNYNSKTNKIEIEQVSLILSNDYLISFQESTKPIFEHVAVRLDKALGGVRVKNIDFLLYKILDTIIDDYFIIVDYLSDQSDDIETEVTDNPNQQTSHDIQILKKKIVTVSKSILPTRELLNRVISGNMQFISTESMNYFKDVYDHAYLISENIDNKKMLMADLMNIYLSNISNKLNYIMKVLTIISTIFMPLSFLTGVYGMNLRILPGADNSFSIYYFFGTCLLVVIVMLIYFKNKRWF